MVPINQILLERPKSIKSVVQMRGVWACMLLRVSIYKQNRNAAVNRFPFILQDLTGSYRILQDTFRKQALAYISGSSTAPSVLVSSCPSL